ncbi:Glutamate--cysteine ligase [Planctomycetales bacterium 10988]|nr:Glutamate--cysteine ligase [Planctomycetales bacterium 10988]
MKKISFESSAEPTLGVEIELGLVDEKTMGLASKFNEVVGRLPEEFGNQIKPELMQCYLEINTGVCHTVAEAEEDLRSKLLLVQRAADEVGVRLLWSATHPFSSWKDQKLTQNDRYEMILNLLQDMARQLITFGLHVHVGVDSGDKAVMLCDRLMRHLPLLLAVSANSPWWEGRATGLRSHRSKIMEALPTAGMPTFMRNWSEYVWLVKHLIDTGFINTIREIWWDVRPHHNFGTVEVRICDMPGNLQDTMAVVALVHSLVKALSDEIDQGTYQHDCHPMMARQNKWRASRYGMEAELVDEFTLEVMPVRQRLQRLVASLWPAAEQLQCTTYLEQMLRMAEGPGWADKQLQLFEERKDIAEVVRSLTARSRIED